MFSLVEVALHGPIRETLSTELSAVDILMHVDERSDSFGSTHFDNLFDLINICLIELAFNRLSTLPKKPES